MSITPSPSPVGAPVDRVDGRLKVTGAARYTADVPVPGLVHAVFATSTIAAGRIASIDAGAAVALPGVLAVLTHESLPRLVNQPVFGPISAPAMSFAPLQGPEICYSGQPIAIVVAETLEQAAAAAALLVVHYEQRPAVGTLAQARGQAYPVESIFGGMFPGTVRRGDAAGAFAAAAAQVDATYTLPTLHHHPIEPFATTAVWEGDTLTLYDTTQGVVGTQVVAADLLGLESEQVRVVAEFIGGGFGCKGLPWPQTALTALAARAVGRPVKLVLTRAQMATMVGLREEREQRVRLGATAEGQLTALLHDNLSLTSHFDEFSEPTANVTQIMYACPTYASSYRLARANITGPTALRGPGENSGLFALESAMDELAEQLGLDPLSLRLRNYAATEPGSGRPWSSNSLRACYARGAELFGWERRTAAPRSMREGRLLVGYGMASATYPVNNFSSVAEVALSPAGEAVVRCATQDIGTGTRTVMAQVAADALGLPVGRVRVELGDTTLPPGMGSGGSAVTAAVGSAVQRACEALLQTLAHQAAADPRSALYGADPLAIVSRGGLLVDTAHPQRSELCLVVAARQPQPVTALGIWQPDEAARRAYAMHAFGAHFAEVHIDPELGTVRVARWVGVFAGGRIINRKTAHSQLVGGIVGGIGQALHEQTVMDASYARYTNPDLAEYLIPTHADIPPITVELLPEEDPHVNLLGVKGIGELGIVGASAAVVNAVAHATGVRIRALPLRIEQLLEGVG